ncbi:MAG: STAS domain-containing protein [Beijerinckiaceae bacterium]
MQISISEFDGPVARVVLVGKIDISGADEIDLPLAALAGKRNSVVVDMAEVEFLASIGIRHLVQAAKSISRGGGKLVLLKPTSMVTDVLLTSGFADILPIVQSEADARMFLNLQGPA